MVEDINKDGILLTQINTGAAVVDSIKILGAFSLPKATLLPISMALSLGLYMNFGKLLDIVSHSVEIAASSRAERIHSTALSDSVIRGRQTNALLYTLLVNLKSSRATAWLFHNGTESLTGVPFLKLDEIGEMTGAGVSHEIANNQNLPIDIVSEWLPAFIKKECLTTTLDTSTGSLKAFMLRYGVAKIFACPFFSRSHNEPLGYIAISYATNWETPENAEAYSAIKSAAIAQGAVIDAYQDSIK